MVGAGLAEVEAELRGGGASWALEGRGLEPAAGAGLRGPQLQLIGVRRAEAGASAKVKGQGPSPRSGKERIWAGARG